MIPARAAKPREKAKVAVGGQVVARWMLARLRHHTCFALAAGQAALAPLLSTLKARPVKTWPGSRQELCATLDRPALPPRPAQPDAYAEGQLARVNIDDHVEVEGHDASVPSALVRQQLDVRLRAAVVERCAKGKRVASQPRSPHKGRHRTVAAPMPKAPQPSGEWTPPRVLHWAAPSGPATAQVVDTLLASRPHPQQGFRAC